MSEPLGRGLCGSLNARVDHEIRELARDNLALRRARYSLGRRLLRTTVVGRSVAQFLLLYSAVLVVALFGEWAVSRYLPCRLPKYSDTFEPGFLKDLGSYLIAGQIGILALSPLRSRSSRSYPSATTALPSILTSGSITSNPTPTSSQSAASHSSSSASRRIAPTGLRSLTRIIRGPSEELCRTLRRRLGPESKSSSAMH